MNRILLYMLMSLVYIHCVIAVGYIGNPKEMTQPDGSRVIVYLNGSETYITAKSEDGYTLVRDRETGYICYAKLSDNKRELISTGIKYRGSSAPEFVINTIGKNVKISSEARDSVIKRNGDAIGYRNLSKSGLRSSVSLPDTVYGVCLLIQFKDRAFDCLPSEVDTFLNATSGATVYDNEMSVRQYFDWISGGRLTYINYVSKRIFVAPNDFSYYSPEDADTYTPDNLLRVVELCLQSLNKDIDGFDLTDLTMQNGRPMAINILYAGESPENWAKGLWPHQGEREMNLGTGFDNDIPQRYQISSTGKSLSMGTFIHENCHLLLGFTDFYSFDESNDDNNAQVYNIGDSFGAFDKHADFPNPYSLDLLGWLDHKQDITNVKGGKTVTLNYGVGNAAVYYGTGTNSNERYYFEVRKHHYYDKQKTENEGVFVWHVNTDGNNNYSGYDELLDCRPATLENPMWNAATGSKIFDDESIPSAKWADGSSSGLYLYDFSSPSETMTFKVGRTEAKDLEIVTTDLAIGSVESEYRSVVQADGGDWSYTFSDPNNTLPSTLSLSEDGHITGVPTEMYEGMVSITVTDGNGVSVSKEIVLKIDEAIRPVSVKGDIEGEASLETTCMWELGQQGGYGNYKFEIIEGSLPPGVELTKEGYIYGVPTEIGEYEAKIRISSKGISRTTYCDVCVRISVKETIESAVTITLKLIKYTQNLYVGQEVNDTVRYKEPGFGKEYNTFRVADGSLPNGIEITSDGRITGTPTEVGVYSVLIECTSRKELLELVASAGITFVVKEGTKVQNQVDSPVSVIPTVSDNVFIVTGIKGKAVCTVCSVDGSKTMQFDATDGTQFGSDLKCGIYIVYIDTDDGTNIVKIVKK